MPKITFILGLCASGKSHIAKELQKEKDTEILDEGFSKFSNNFEENYSQVILGLRNGKDFIIIEIGLCRRSEREYVIQGLQSDITNIEVEWICISNDLAQANQNVLDRANRGEKQNPEGHIDINNRVALEYTYPEGAKIIPTFRPTS